MKLKGNILVITQWSYKDALVQTYTLPYVEIIRKIISPGQKIFVVTSEQQRISLSESETGEINKEWSKRNMILVAQPYSKFGIKKVLASFSQLFRLYRLIKKENIGVIHTFCTPAGSIGYILSKLTGRPLVADSYEPHATAMVETGAWKKNSPAFKILFRLEKLLTKRARYIIATTSGMKEYAKENYGAGLGDFFVKPACIDFSVFYPRPKDLALSEELELGNKLVCVYAGKLGGTYLKDEVFDFVKACYDFWKEDFRFLMLTSEPVSLIAEQIKRTGIPGGIVISKFVPHTDIPVYMSLGDFAINPQVPVPSKRYGTPIKNGEYWGMGLPVVISPGVSDDSDIIQENGIGVVFDMRNKEEMPRAVERTDQLLKENTRTELQQKIFALARQYRSFAIAQRIYPQIYEN